MTTRTPQQAIAYSGSRTLAVVALALLALLAAGPAQAATGCAQKVIDDWYDNGRVDKEYPYHCYEDAIDSLPIDVKDYSSAAEDIQRALQARLRGEPAPPATHDPSPDDGSDPGAGSGGSGGSGGQGPLNEGLEVLGPSDASSVPIPLLVLAGLALLLVAAGSAGYAARRLQARRAGAHGLQDPRP